MMGLEELRNFWMEYRKYKSGIVGLVLLMFLVVMAVGAPLFAPQENYENWMNSEYWVENPKGVPPAWVNYFSSKKLPTHLILTEPAFFEEQTVCLNWTPRPPSHKGLTPIPETTSLKLYNLTYTYDFHYDEPPRDIMFRILGVMGGDAPMDIRISIVRPDGKAVVIRCSYIFTEAYQDIMCITISLTTTKEAVAGIWRFAEKHETEANLNIARSMMIDEMDIVFREAAPGMIFGDTPLLKGTYILNILVEAGNPMDRLDGVRVIISGKVYGLLGTDMSKRDLFTGIVWGSRLALIVGVVTSLLCTLIGVLYGVVSAYVGGLKDEFMQRIYEIVASIPVLPILILMAVMFKPSIWNLVLMMVLFYWTGPVKTARSMALQIKEETYVEAARAIGASGTRIVMKYIFAQLLPYSFALMALSVPGAILTEAGISFLMGGEIISEPTWGRILHDAQGYSKMWWWILPPGVMICIAGLSFVLIGYALDKILNPMLKH